mgnify:CR=1 FL=1|tara:strand:- start:98 stop:1180 length:1083 start_codon:yes stop_codon:yes gene_type:complete
MPLGAGSYTTNTRTYTSLMNGDVVEGGSERITRGLWSDNVGTLAAYHISSGQSSTQQQYYYEIYNGVSTTSTSEPQFSVVYGHKKGSGSLSTNSDSPTQAIYSQYAQTLLDDNKTTFEFNSVSTQHIYAVNIQRARLKDRLDPGNFQLNLARLSGSSHTNLTHTGSNVNVDGTLNEVIRLIDDSGDSLQTQNQIGRVFNLVSGSITAGIYSPTTYYGSVYPEQGVIILNADTLDTNLEFNSVTSSNLNGDNAFKLFTAISGAHSISTSDGFQARNEEEVKSTYYFVRAKNAEYNFSNNPTFASGSNGKLTHATFVNNPKVYITTVGLYNEHQELLAVAKLSQPILKSFANEILVKCKLDF